ncbi:MAG: DUF1987 domain-containing protein [Gammaproteobacteria bacterium]|jgi:hypothetical protein|nr:DUF1987 domain-containing protein [Gammaproteobacteria bacterium]
MDDLFLCGTASCPEVDFRFSEHRLALRGESYPENAAAFYGPLIERLRTYLERLREAEVTVDVALRYFNSSSTKLLFNLFGMLNEAARSGNTVVVRWHYDPDDDNMSEFGQELKMDFADIRFLDAPLGDA